MTRILGVSCGYHDAAAALVVDGELVAAAEEERFSREKHDQRVPIGAIAACLATAGTEAGAIDHVVYHEKPLLVIGRVLASRQRKGIRGLPAFTREFPTLLRDNLSVGYRLQETLRTLGARRPPTVHYGEHHLSHAAAAFYPSPFSSAAILTVDGIGEWATATYGYGTADQLDVRAEQRYPHSFGLLYSLVTSWCGFEANDGEYKLMGLAPFGTPRFLDELRQIADVHDDGSVTLDMQLLRDWSAPKRLPRIAELLGGPPRERDAEITARDMDLAASMQVLLEESLLAMARHAHERTGARRLCMAGGVALNCVANSRLLTDGPFEDVWVQPAAGDAGSALGAALWFWHAQLGQARPGRDHDGMSGGSVGPSFADDEVERWVRDEGLDARRFDDAALVEHLADRLAEGAVVGRLDGRMEFGPRALGHRSILADPRSPTIQRDLNVRVKGRESFRPFAPAVLWEHAAEWFEIDRPSPYMLFVHQVHPSKLVDVTDPEPTTPAARVQVARSRIPACTHIDGSARVQTVHAETDARFHALISAFHQRTGCPVLLNTSFNLAGEPIVCTPDDALATALQGGIDVLVIDNHVIELTGAGA